MHAPIDWVLTDHINTVRDLVSYNPGTDTTTPEGHITYDAFGNVTNTPAVDILFGYTGRLWDEDTGLQNNLNRWYDPAVGRWLSEDPIGFDAKDANLYRYCGNCSVIYVDPAGLDTYWQNRKIGGSTRKSNYNKLSHSFIFTTNSNGTVAHTYSWGNTANPHGWNKDQPEDIAAANEALKDKATEKRGDAELDPFVNESFNEMNKKKNEHRWWPWNTCKTEARGLLRNANEKLIKSTKGAKK